jgi:MoaA/NifB/PqqE/SkfB family radical SAM enzyme
MDVRRTAQRLRRKVKRGLDILHPSRLLTNGLVQLNVRTHRTWALPIVVYSPTSRCNSRCSSCDYWRTDGANDLARGEVAALCQELATLQTKLVIFTGGEPLVREDVFELADLFRAQGVTLHLLTSGLALERHAQAVVERFSAVTISLDGHTPELYRNVRGVDGLAAVERGVKRIKQLRPALPVRARSTLHKQNFWALTELIDKAESMGLDQVSFLSADVTSTGSFGRNSLRVESNAHGLLLDGAEVDEFERVIEKALVSRADAFRHGKVAERDDRLRRLARYYGAHLQRGPFPRVDCNAPWASAVIESDGTLRPCFFQPPVGNVRSKSLRALLDDEMVSFRRRLNVGCDATCQRCVCSLRVDMKSRLW